jgi:hypothetical protein
MGVCRAFFFQISFDEIAVFYDDFVALPESG